MSSIYDEGKRVNALNEERALEDERELREVLSRKSGRRHIFKILEEGYIFTTTFTKSSQGFYNEGKREMALKQFNAILDLDPDIFSKMCKEFRNQDG